MNVDTPSEKASSMDIDEITERMEELSAHPMATNMVEIQNFFDRPMACINKFRRPALIPKSVKDENGYFHVYVASIDLVDSDNMVYSVNLVNLKNELTVYKTLLNMTYDRDIPLMTNQEDYAKHSASLLMIKVEGQWSRCIQLTKTEDTILLEDIDSGKKYSFNAGFPFKVPQKQELARNAFAFKMVISNVIDRTGIDVGDIIKIRFLKSNLRGVSEAEVEIDCLDREEQPMELENVDEKLPQDAKDIYEKPKAVEMTDVKSHAVDKPPAEIEDPRILIKQLKVKNFPVGRQLLTYIDGSKIGSGRIHVCLATAENVAFTDKLFYEIQQYIALNDDKNGYKPV